MRKSMDALSALVSGQLSLDPFSGHLFAFRNRRRNLVKVLYWDRNGFCLWQKRLEKDRFRWPDDAGAATDAPGAGGTQEAGTQPVFDGGGEYASAEEDGGCTCASAGRPVSAAWWTALAALAAWMRRRASSRRRGGDH